MILHALVRELDQELPGGRLQKFSQLTDQEFVLHFRKPGRTLKLLISLRPGESRLHLVDGDLPPAQVPSAFVMLGRKHLEGKPLEAVEQPGLERIAHLIFAGGYRLVLEIPGRSNNLVLTDPEGKVLGLFQGSPNLRPGRPYRPPERPDLPTAWDLDAAEAAELEAQGRLTSSVFGLPGRFVHQARDWDAFWRQLREGPLEPGLDTRGRPVFQGGDLTSMQQAVQAAYAGASTAPGLEDKRRLLLKDLGRRLDKARRKLDKRRLDQSRARGAEGDKLKGDLLLAYSSSLDAQAGRVSLPAWEADQPPVEIELDRALSVADNAQQYYARYRKKKRAQEALEDLIEQARGEVTFYEEMVLAAEQAEDVDDLAEVRSALPSRRVRKKTPAPSSGPRRFRANGFELLVGRNPAQNDQLTGRLAARDDLWFHAREIPGSHVILRTAGRAPREEDLLAGAVLAARYSQAASSPKVEVIYTQVKYLKKPPNSPPGKVIYRNEKSILVDPAQEVPGLEALT